MNKTIGERLDGQVNRLLRLPDELALNLPKINLSGNLRLNIDNHKGIRRYSNEQIIIRYQEGMIVVEGMDLLLDSISREELSISGRIRSVRFTDTIR